MRDIVVFREPKLKPLPIAAQDKMKDAPLLVRLQTAKTAIEACYDLSELLKWKDQAAAIAAAAKAAKMPDIAKGANRICKEALLRLGQLLSAYSNTTAQESGKGSRLGAQKSARGQAVAAAGIRPSLAGTATRLASAPRQLREAVLEDDRIPAHGSAISAVLTARGVGRKSGRYSSSAFKKVMSGTDEYGRKSGGLASMLVYAKDISLADIRALEPDEKRRARAKVIEIIELLDAIEEACK